MAKETWLKYVKLSDAYERKARFLPGFISMLPLLLPMAAFGCPAGDWAMVIIGGAGIGAVLSVLLSHVAAAFGNRLQEKLWPRWPLDSPTNRWLHPKDQKVSRQQKDIWYEAINSLTRIDIRVRRKDVEAEINDAVVALRNIFWKRREADRLDQFNASYGFARNLAGMRCFWGTFLVTSAVACWLSVLKYGSSSLVWAIASTVMALIGVPVAIWVLPRYVRKRADYYAESFFGTLMAVYESKKPPADRAEQVTT